MDVPSLNALGRVNTRLQTAVAGGDAGHLASVVHAAVRELGAASPQDPSAARTSRLHTAETFAMPAIRTYTKSGKVSSLNPARFRNVNKRLDEDDGFNMPLYVSFAKHSFISV